MAMKRTLTDFSQLTRRMVAPAPAPEPPKPVVSDEDRAAAEVLAYFTKPGAAPRKTASSASAAKPVDPRVAELEQALAARAGELAATSAALAAARAQGVAAQEEIRRLKESCAQLRAERDRARTASVASAPEPPPAAASAAPPPAPALLVPPKLNEMFPGEAREMVLDVLADAAETAASTTRERRGRVLAAVLAANPSSGALAARRQALKQALKDAGFYNDPKVLEGLGFRLVSGRNHWKIEYADVRIPLAKTPSDFRSNRNAAADISNRCF